jgi:integrase
MGVRVKKHAGKWYVFINWKGKRKARCVGLSREAAEQVRREIERQLSLGQFTGGVEKNCPTFSEYATCWLATHVRPNLKLSTVQSYEGILRFHLLPAFGSARLDGISRTKIKSYLAELTKPEDRAKNTARNILAALRALLNHAVEDGLIDQNPASRLGRFNLAKGRGRKVEFLTRDEASRFLETAKEIRSQRHPLFLTAVRAGLRLGELVALEWDDIQFGADEEDANRFLMVRHNLVRGQVTSPKGRKARRVDLSRDLRRTLMELRDSRTLQAIEKGQFDEGGQPKIPKVVFPSRTGRYLNGTNLYHRDFLPCLQAAGLRRVTFHALRHTFASLLIQKGASLAYVREQMGHSSIQVTVDTYGHLIPGGNIAWVDALDEQTSPQQNATPAQQADGVLIVKARQVIEKDGAGEGNRTPDLRFTKPFWSRRSTSDQQLKGALSWGETRLSMTFAPLFAPPFRASIFGVRSLGNASADPRIRKAV